MFKTPELKLSVKKGHQNVVLEKGSFPTIPLKSMRRYRHWIFQDSNQQILILFPSN